MSLPILLSVFAIPSISIPFVYLAGKKSTKAAAIFVALIALVNIALIMSTVPAILANGSYQENYTWIPTIINTEFTLYLDGISASVALISLVLMFVASIFSVNYMAGKKHLAAYYALLCMLSVGLIGVFLTSNMILFYFCWELMLVPAYFIVGEWGYRNSYKSALKLFIFTHAGAVFVLLGIGAIYWLTQTTDMFAAQTALVAIALPDVSSVHAGLRQMALVCGYRCTLRSTRANVCTTQRCNHQRRSLRNIAFILRHGFSSGRNSFRN